jgi:hypothetical protein
MDRLDYKVVHHFLIVYTGVVFKAITLATATHVSHYCTCLGHIGHCYRERIISFAQGKQIRRKNTCDIVFDILNIANVNTAFGVQQRWDW